MKKRLLLPLAITLALVIAISGMALAVAANGGEPSLRISGANLSFEENVHILYAVDYDKIDNPADIKLLIYRGNVKVENCTVENAVAQLTPTDVVDENGVKGLVFEYSDVAAANMTENIYARAYVTQGEKIIYSPVVKYSILQYAMNMLGVTGTPTENEKLAVMLEKMLEYGAAAQEVFEVNLDRLATDNYVKVNFEGAILADGLNYGLLKVGEKVDVFAPVDETNPYALWTDANGNAVGNGGKIEYTAGIKNTTVKAATMATEPTYGAYDRVIIIGVDGAGSFYPDNVNAESTRIQNKIFGNGAVTRTMRVGTPTSSCISWGELLHGVEVENHGVVENYMCEESPTWNIDSKYPSILKLAKEANPEADVAALYAWIGIQGLVEQNDGIDTINASDVDLTNYIVNDYLENHDPKMLYVHLQNPDYIGHTVGHHTTEYYSAIDKAYEQIEEIYDKLDANGMLENTLFIVTSDHGGVGKGHGGLTDYEKYAMFAVAGKTVINGEIGAMYMRDGASIALYALGIAQPNTYTSALPANLFNGVDAGTHKEYHDPDSPRYHIPEQTPAAGNAGYITNMVNNNLLAYLPFDGTTTDVLGRDVVEIGEISYEDGYFGQGVNLNDGHLNIMNFAPGKDSFTLAFWMKTPSPHLTSPLVMNKEWSTNNQGIHIAMERDTSKANPIYFRWGIGSGTVSASTDTPLPDDFYTGWMHVIYTVDRANNELRLSIDFGEEIVKKIESQYDANLANNADLTSIYNYLVLGNDATNEEWEYKCGFSVDEFMYFDGAFTRNDINDLCEYFNREPVVPDEKSVIDVFDDADKPDIYFNFNGNTANNGVELNNVEVVGNVAYGDGKEKQSAYFSGTNALILDDFKLGTDDFAVAVWVKPTDCRTVSGNRYKLPIVSTANEVNRTAPGFNVMLDVEHSRIVVTWSDGQGHDFETKSDYILADFENQWNHIVVATDKTDINNIRIKVYVNFNLAVDVPFNHNIGGTPTNTKLPNLTADVYPFTIGEYGVASSKHDAKMYLDDLMVFKRLLSTSDVMAMMEYYYNIKPMSDYLDKKPVVDIDFNGDVKNDGTYTGALVDGGVQYVAGKIGSGATFTGSGVELTDLKLDGNDAIAFSFWINTNYLDYSGSEPYVLNLFSTQNDKREALGLSIKFSREYKIFQVCVGGNEENPNNAESAYVGGYWEGIMQADKWMHVVIVIRRNPNKNAGEHYVEFYFDGERGSIKQGFDIQPHLFAEYLFDAPGRTAHIGSNGLGTGTAFTEYLDEFMLFDTALTAEEVAQLYEYYAQFN